ncbi:MAG: hypothetical protein EXR62_00405 [Chloroflexi bacterium]|nr:hypothetical protein [Chloroflexota bacterium]
MNSPAKSLQGGQVHFQDLEDLPRLMDAVNQRPKLQWWMELRPVFRVLAQSAPQSRSEQLPAE